LKLVLPKIKLSIKKHQLTDNPKLTTTYEYAYSINNFSEKAQLYDNRLNILPTQFFTTFNFHTEK